MTVALLSIGTELLRGEASNTAAPWLAQELTLLGYTVAAIETVADERDALATTLRRLAQGHPLVIATGGLGPTTDDLTAEVAAQVSEAALHCDENALAAIRRRVEQLGLDFKPGHEKQAHLPEGAHVLLNVAGTAPGFACQIDRATIFFLPGSPHEMRRMFTEQVVPRIRAAAPHNTFQLKLRTFGLRESEISERLAGLTREHPDVSLAFQSNGEEVDLNVLSQAGSYAQARQLAEAAAAEARKRLDKAVYGEGDDTLLRVAARGVRSKGWQLATAESCTGGLIAELITREPASDYFVGGVVSYANTAKTNLLGVSEDTLRGHGAVSAEVAAEMAEAARRAFDCQVAVAVTGIAGPTGATATKPLGCCFWALAHPDGTVVEHRVFTGDRTRVQHQAASAVFDLVRRTLQC